MVPPRHVYGTVNASIPAAPAGWHKDAYLAKHKDNLLEDAPAAAIGMRKKPLLVELAGKWHELTVDMSPRIWLAFAMVSAFTFSLVMLPFALWYCVIPVLAWLVFGLAVVAASTCFWLSTRYSAATNFFYQALALAIAWSTFTGACTGVLDHMIFTQNYYTYRNSADYANVIPTGDASAMQDAGTLAFSADSFLDWSKSVGYKDKRMYCVAPVMTRSPVNSSLAGFWAAGIDCCKNGFACDGARNSEVRTGIRVIGKDVARYNIAAKQVAATHSLKLPEQLVFMRWVKNPDEVIDGYWNSAVLFYASAVGMNVAGNCIMVLLLVCSKSEFTKTLMQTIRPKRGPHFMNPRLQSFHPRMGHVPQVGGTVFNRDRKSVV